MMGTPLSPQAAYKAMFETPGVETTVAGGLTARQSVGLDPIPAAVIAKLDADASAGSPVAPSGTATTLGPAVVTPASIQCWSGSRSYQWSSWPYERVLTDHASWCANYSWSLTSWSHSPSQNGSYCIPAGAWAWTVNYYSGSPYAQFDDAGNWTCQAGSPYNQQQGMDLYLNSYGNYWINSVW